MTNKILALKYRPQEFKDLIGQEVMAQTITNAIKLSKTPNAYLLTGIRGVGGLESGGLDTIAEDAGKIAVNVAKVAGEETTGTTLEGIGGALDATGIFAPIGALFGVAGTALDVAGAVQVGKGVVDWVNEDVLQKPMPNAPQIQMPNQPYTIAQRGMGIIPNMDSLNLPSSVSSKYPQLN
mgnify:CR=1 FL=1